MRQLSLRNSLVSIGAIQKIGEISAQAFLNKLINKFQSSNRNDSINMVSLPKLLIDGSIFNWPIFVIDISRKDDYIIRTKLRRGEFQDQRCIMEYNHIQITPGICGGKPHISGHRIRVQDIVIWHEKMGLSADEILLHFPTLTFSDIYAALTYYFDHKEQIDSDIREEERYSESFLSKHPSKLKSKLKEAHV